MGRQPRQRPVSCNFCRVRKLRCSREFPCSNCTSRGVQCQAQDPPRAPGPSSRPVSKRAGGGVSGGVSGSGSGGGGSGGGGGGPSSAGKEADILSRLERLEALLAERNKGTDSNSNSRTISSAPSSVEGSDVASRTQLEPLQPLPINVQNLTADALWLESSCLGPKPSPSCYIFQNSSVPSGFLSLEPTRCIWLPQRHETKVLVHKYTSVITFMHHVVHIPSLYKLVDEVYDAVEKGTQVSLCSVLLMLAVCTNVTYAWTAVDNNMTPLFSDYTEANNQSFGWLKSTFDVFDASQRRSEIGLELAQGLIIVSFVLLNLEGVSSRARNCFFNSITICRELGLHRLDHPHNPPSVQIPQLSPLKMETARRVWWYLIGTDAMISRFPGPHEGTYLINPRQMNVRKPLNADDEDLVEGQELVGKPMNCSTNMSYFLQRVRLAEVVRNFTDRVPLTNSSNPDVHSYGLVLEVDAAIEQFIEDLPPFLKFNTGDLQQLPATEAHKKPGLIIQRHIMNVFVHGQRCKLHLPYLARGAVEPTYARSRRVCLDSARMVIQTEHQLEKEATTFNSTRLRLCLVLHSVFIASIVLLLDFCLGADADAKEQRREDLLEAWDILEAAKELSRPTARIQDLLTQVMKKHKVTLPVGKERQRPVGCENLPLTPSSSTAILSNGTTPNDAIASVQDLSDMGLNMDLEGMDWENLLWGLEAPLF
ncbi:zinc finger transcription factor YRR1 [Fusarium pseudocircinatum]|uniref:Zinc finger transcription factor YRR1 n=1 Tax=Fusarium pseudocircinatum TaxID=56676 RepID=A0A8H5PJL5_9HYPO|nr:zinc finger transcription factor YRR1 [Fusarium pseudocircinatum]